MISRWPPETAFISGVPWTTDVGYDEFVNWSQAFGSDANPGAFRGVYNVGGDDIFQMIEEASTGHGGSLGRQLTLNPRSTSPAALPLTHLVLDALELADSRGTVNLRVAGSRMVGPGERIVLPDPGSRENT